MHSNITLAASTVDSRRIGSRSKRMHFRIEFSIETSHQRATTIAYTLGVSHATALVVITALARFVRTAIEGASEVATHLSHSHRCRFVITFRLHVQSPGS